MGKPHADVDRLEPRTHFAAGDPDVSLFAYGVRDIGVGGSETQFARLPNGGHQITIERQYTYYEPRTDEYSGEQIPEERYDLSYDTYRLKPDGSIDRKYGSDGYADSPLDNVIAARAVPDGSVYLFGYAGNHYDEPEAGTPTIVKLTPNGTVDRHFGTRGSVALRQSLFTGAYIRDAVLGSHGELTVMLEDSTTFLRHFDPATTADPTFGGRRRVEITAKNRAIYGVGLAIDASNAVFVGGNVQTLTHSRNFGIGVFKLAPNGRTDTTFGRSGIALTSTPAALIALDVVVDDAGRPTVLGGRLEDGSIKDFDAAFSRFTPAGRPDPAFGNAGEAFPPVPVSSYDDVTSLAVAGDGSLVVSDGETMFRVDAAGKNDAAFGQVVVDGDFVDAADPMRVQTLRRGTLRAVQVTDNGTGGSFALKNGTLYVGGSRGNDDIGVVQETDSDTGAALYFQVNVNDFGRIYPADAFRRVVINGGAGRDDIGLLAEVRRGVLIDGGAGDDTIEAYGRFLSLYGGEGNDHISVGFSGRYPLFNALIDGGAGNDSLVGGDLDDTIFGGSGNDDIDGGGGRDLIYGNAGDDKLYGGSAVDTLDGGRGSDSSLNDEYDDKSPDVLVSIERR